MCTCVCSTNEQGYCSYNFITAVQFVKDEDVGYELCKEWVKENPHKLPRCSCGDVS